MTLREFRDVLCSIPGVSVYHQKAHKSADNYIVWQEIKGLSLDGVPSEKGMRIAVDFYTKKEYSGIPAEITSVLSAYDDICIDDPVIDYEDDTGFTHYAYTVEVFGDG